MTKIAVVTGAAGGIGAATARCFADAGWQVVGVDRSSPPDWIDGHKFVQADVADSAALRQLFERLQSTHGRLDALVNNAAVQVIRPLVETAEEDWDRVMAVNVRAAYVAIKAAPPLLRKSSGSVVNIASVHSVATSAGMAAYVASKGALLALTRAVALEFAQDQIRVNAVLPGAIDTEMLRAGLARDVDMDVEEALRVLGEKHPVGRVGKPEEIAQAVLFLADGERSSFITGQSLIVDGGATAKLSTE